MLESLGYLVFRLHRAMYTEYETLLKAYGLTGAQSSLLVQVRAGVVTPKAIATALQIDRAAVTRLLDELEQRQMVRRVANPKDKRSTLLQLTPAAEAVLPRMRAAGEAINQQVLSYLAPAERSQLLKLLRKLATEMPARVFPLKRRAV